MTKVVNYLGQSGKVKAGCLITILVVVLLIAGGGYLLYTKGMAMVAEQVTTAIQDDAAIKEHIGEIQSVEMNISATATATEDQQKKEDGKEAAVMVFDIVGSKGNGTIAVVMDKEQKGSAVFTSATLTMDGGQTYPVVLKSTDPEEKPVEKPAETPPEEKPAVENPATDPK